MLHKIKNVYKNKKNAKYKKYGFIFIPLEKPTPTYSPPASKKLSLFAPGYERENIHIFHRNKMCRKSKSKCVNKTLKTKTTTSDVKIKNHHHQFWVLNYALTRVLLMLIFNFHVKKYLQDKVKKIYIFINIVI